MINFFLLLDWLLLFVGPTYSELQELDGLKINTDLNSFIDPVAPESNSIAYVDSSNNDFLVDESETYQFARCAPNASFQSSQDDTIVGSNTNTKNIRRQLTQSCRSSDSPETSNKNPSASSQPGEPKFHIFKSRPPSERCRSDELLITCTGPEIDLGESTLILVMNCVGGT